ncbi:MAG: SRPBCC family protein [Chloroflexi bacterium]|nr:SRPBCC family protein [Chloroflexota bacterium]
MKPIEIKIVGTIHKTPQDICAQFLDLERWSDFKGYSILPGIESAAFENRTPAILGSRIKVQNTDGSSHVEEIIRWDTARGIAMKFQDFSPPLQSVASHFIETWEFHPSAEGTMVTRSMSMVPKNALGWLILFPISKLMKKAFEKNMAETAPAK